MTCRDDVGTTGPDKSESKRYLLVPNCFLGYHDIIFIIIFVIYIQLFSFLTIASLVHYHIIRGFFLSIIM